MLNGAALDGDNIRRLVLTPPEGQHPLVEGWASLDEQVQPCGIDFRVLRIDRLLTAGRMGVGADDRTLPESEALEFGKDGWVFLEAGSYLVTCCEVVNMPLDLMALALPRSSLVRSGVALPTAVWDPGYRGRSQALLAVQNPAGYHIRQYARFMQMVFFRLSNPAPEGYSGRYQDERP